MEGWRKLTLTASLCCFVIGGSYQDGGNFTRALKRNALLSRSKRFLTFPEGSNFVVTGSYIKAFLQVQPTGWNFIQEIDLPFVLPSDTKVFDALKMGKLRHRMERRHVRSKLKMTLQRFGFDAESCLLRMVCDIRKINNDRRRKSLREDVLYAILTDSTGDDYELEKCQQEEFLQKCNIPFVDIFLNSVMEL